MAKFRFSINPMIEIRKEEKKNKDKSKIINMYVCM